jgi:hypothetical protein
MSAVGKFIHNSAHSGLTIALTNAYVAGAQRHQIPFWSDSPGIVGNKAAKGRLSALYIKVDTIAAGATGLTFRITRDAAGNNTVVPDTTATLSTGITTATEGAIVAKIDVDYQHTDTTLWCHMKTNAGTCNVKSIELVWEE